MSLLLDALKKAALEKEKRNQAAREKILLEEGDVPEAEAAGEDESYVHDQSAGDDSLEIDHDEVDRAIASSQALDAEINADIVEPSSETVIPEELVHNENPDGDEFQEQELSSGPQWQPTQYLDISDEPHSPEPEDARESSGSVDPEDEEELSLDSVDDTEEFSLLPEADSTTEVSATEAKAAQDLQKRAMGELLDKTHAAVKAERRRNRLLFLCLAVCAFAFIGFYIYYLSFDAQQGMQFSPGQGFSATEYVADEAIDEDVDAETEVGVAEVNIAVERADADKNVDGSAEISQVSTDANTESSERTQVASTPIVEEATPVSVKPDQETTLNSEPNPEPKSQNVVARVEKTSDPLADALSEGYRAFQQGRVVAAESAYRRALQLAPNHRDALLGLAAIAVQGNHYDEALKYYQQRLYRAPQDPYALAGILALASTAGTDPALVGEVNEMLFQFPEAAHLHFLKGSMAAANQRWGEAYLAFSDAQRRDPTQVYYSYNLAIASDHSQRFDEALKYYQLTLQLAADKAVNFDRDGVIKRMRQLRGVQP